MNNGNQAQSSDWTNLDLLCAQAAEKIAGAATDQNTAKELDKLATDALGVLAEQGVYALFLYLKSKEKEKEASASRSEKEKKDNNSLAHKIQCNLLTLLIRSLNLTASEAQEDDKKDKQNEKPNKAIKEIARDLDTLLLAWELLGRTLTYTRYHARVKAPQEG